MKNITINHQNISWLSFFRVGIAAICFFNFLTLQSDFALLYYKDAYSVPEISRLISPTIIPTFYDIHLYLNHYVSFDYNALLMVFRIVYPLSLLSLLIGFHSRISAIVALLLFVVFINSYNCLYYGFDVFVNISLFYCVIFPVGRYNAINKNKKNISDLDERKYLYLLRTHICLVYFFSGFDKLLGFNWRNGESLWKALHSLSSQEWVNLDFLANTPFFLIGGWLTIILEMLYPIFINFKTTRKVWLFGIVGMHFSIAVLMNLYFFSAIMIILNLTAYYIPYGKVQENHHDLASNDKFVAAAMSEAM